MQTWSYVFDTSSSLELSDPVIFFRWLTTAQICALHSNLSPVATHVLLGASCVFIFTRNVQLNNQSGQIKSETEDKKVDRIPI